MSKVIFERSVEKRFAYNLPECDVPVRQTAELLPPGLLRQAAAELPELSEADVLRHFVELSNKNHGVLSGFYPLGSCTMKYNPAINEVVCSLPGFAQTHPAIDCQGSYRLMYELQEMLAEISGMDTFSLQPAAGAHGEHTGLMVMKTYHEKRGDFKRTKILVPDSAHGTNPASVSMVGMETVQIKSDANGNVDLDDLRANIDDQLAGLMLTNPSTLGLFEVNIKEVAQIVHEAGGLLYYDGANLNAIMGYSRPGDMGFDVVHLNLHKTFSTPHGGGGPGAGPVGVKKELAHYLPYPAIRLDDQGQFKLDYDLPDSVGRVRTFFGNFGVLVRAYAYILSMGAAGLKSVSENAVLNANYLMFKLKEFMKVEYDRICMHEFVATGTPQKEKGVSTLDIAKRMLDFGVHPPTIYFPLIVKEAMMFEPTEDCSKEDLDRMAEVLIHIANEDPDVVLSAPHNSSVSRVDETKAAKDMIFSTRYLKKKG